MRKLCDNAEVHDFHYWRGIVQYRCSGVTDCGIETHPAHNFYREDDIWCRGICGCNSKKDHGPGEHK